MGSQSEFQNQFSLLMSKLLHSTVTEATKLFEKTVQEMIAELARIRKQNEVLKDNLFDFEDDVPASSNRLACSKRDVGVQCDAPPPAPKEDPPPLPPTPLQNAKKEEEFALVFVKKEESDTYDETQACIFARISADQPRQLLVQQRDGGAAAETSSVQQASLIPRQVLVQQFSGGETSSSVQQSSLIPKQLLVQQRDGETTLESNLSIVKLAAFQATRDRPTVTLTRLTSSELSAAQNGTLTLSQPKVTAVALTTTTTASPQKPNGIRYPLRHWRRHCCPLPKRSRCSSPRQSRRSANFTSKKAATSKAQARGRAAPAAAAAASP
ncbi:uncharacterized protein LOC134444010 [Engraulis encrasicolus]|uniref:uncharacterized protein LOC134444010 n=1 Tax=Engraulis encrasicolus TaxID=184585 RepID=UPI002FD15DDF